MGCKLGSLETGAPIISVEFKFKPQKQKLFLHVLSQCTQFNLDKIALILDVSISTLIDVYNGHGYLNEEQAIQLAQLLLLYLSD